MVAGRPGAVVDVRSDAERAWVGFIPGGGKVLFLCRSGVRPVAAAQRGRKGGWRFHGLPWRQD